MPWCPPRGEAVIVSSRDNYLDAHRLSSQLAGFSDWTTNFAPHRTGVYWGYDTDAAWTKPLCTTVDDLRALQDKYRDVNPKGMILMATESLYFERDATFSISP